MATFVLEIGSEELPARFLAGEEAELAARFTAALQEASVEHGALHTMSTPRRAIVIIEDVNPVQQEREEEVAGPPVRVAFAADGKPTKALEGFARTNGVSVDDVYRITTEKGEYVAVRKRIGGAAVADLLANVEHGCFVFFAFTDHHNSIHIGGIEGKPHRIDRRTISFVLIAPTHPAG